MSIILGAIADDFTGATDLANTLVKQGMRVVQVIGVPSGPPELGDAQAVVVALKSRTAPVDEAVSQSLTALDWLRSLGAKQIFFKYCSTFDSTDKGNIGPVSDALLEALNAEMAIVCPAFPTNHRTIYQGHLFVGDQLLSESPMKNHPLTPMCNSNLVDLMNKQSAHSVGLVPALAVRMGAMEIIQSLEQNTRDRHRFAVVDAETDEDLLEIGIAISDHLLITGGSGIALGLPHNYRRAGLMGTGQDAATPQVPGKKMVLAGSCSTATRAQLEYIKGRWPTYQLDMDKLTEPEEEIVKVCAWADAQPHDAPIVIYGSAEPKQVAIAQQKFGVEQSGQMMEFALSSCAKRLFKSGFRQIVVAGGETSGAVVSALEVTNLRIGSEIAPGVPWTESLGDQPMALALKSGNFGKESFFEDAFEMLS
ncbi:3-oxo-tetronate kinase [Cohaesibacter celericrescens]|uniref:3-oxo-tetronate kinase n=1 Tax=Cohaesibacter celericrescens TaxID=2067669 RepID=A0A2N5XVP9_9HYPH|nr:3-oxo-tetronate kinase [Cohaesibacter celericrescens]PLW78582.1 hypothetical protein C0081_03735 [Cohaesibacter celericrescens]